MTKMRLGILAPTFLPKCSGAEVFHHNLAARLAANGHDVTVIVPRRQARELLGEGWELPYKLDSYPANLWSWLKRSRVFGFWANRLALSALQRKHGFDVWHAFVLYPAGVVLADWQRRSRVPGLVRAVGDDVMGLPTASQPPHVREALREKLPLADALVALSGEMAEDLSRVGVAKEKIRVIPNAVDIGRFSPDEKARATARADLGIKSDEFVFLCVARNHPQKDLPLLVEAFRRLSSRASGRKTRLVVVGRDVASLAAQTRDISDRIHLLEIGAGPEAKGVPVMPPQRLVDLYRAADSFVLSSLLEGFSSALVEAMAAGLPVVATDVPGIRGVVTDGKEAILVPGRSPEDLAAAMDRVLRDSALRSSMTEAARLCAQQYSWPAVVAAYESLYGELVRRGRPNL